MATVLSKDTVIFANSSPENISYAKEFWRALDDKRSIKSSLHVSGINHRLPTAPPTQRTANYVHETADEVLQQVDHPGLLNNSNEAKRRLKIEEEEYVNQVFHQKKKQQDLLRKRKEERLQKEALRQTTIIDEICAYEDGQGDSDDEAIQAMNDIDDFERMVKLSNEQTKEKKLR